MTSPIAILFLLVSVQVFQGLVLATGAVEIEVPKLSPDSAFFFFTFIWDWIKFILGFFSLSHIGLPWYFAIPFGLATTGALVWSLLKLRAQMSII